MHAQHCIAPLPHCSLPTSVVSADLRGDAQRVAQLRLASAPLPKYLGDLRGRKGSLCRDALRQQIAGSGGADVTASQKLSRLFDWLGDGRQALPACHM